MLTYRVQSLHTICRQDANITGQPAYASGHICNTGERATVAGRTGKTAVVACDPAARDAEIGANGPAT